MASLCTIDMVESGLLWVSVGPLLKRFWADADQKTPSGHNKTVADCGAYCSAKAGCQAFEVILFSS